MGPGGGPHHAQEPEQIGRPQQPAGPGFHSNADQRWEARGRLWAMRAGGQRAGAAGERAGALHR